MTHEIGGILLTGGSSRRLGHDKALLVLDGETLATRAARVLSAVCDRVVEVGSGVTTLPSVVEEPAGAGPLAALLAGVDALDSRHPVLLLAVDLPLVDERVLGLIADRAGVGVAVPVAGGERQWTCARFDGSALAAARRLYASGERSLRAVAREVAVTEIEEHDWREVAPPDAFADIDTAADAIRLGITLP